MELSEFLSPENVLADLRAGSKKQLLQDMAKRAAASAGLEERVVFDVLIERERLGPTGVGGGVAIPHGKLHGVDRIHGAFARLAKPVDYEAIDDRPVDLVFLLLAPEKAGADHLKALARVSRTLRDAETVKKVRAAADAAAVYSVLTTAGLA